MPNTAARSGGVQACRVQTGDALVLGERLGLPAWVVPMEALEQDSRGRLWRGRDRRRGVDVVIKVVPPGQRAHLEPAPPSRQGRCGQVHTAAYH